MKIDGIASSEHLDSSGEILVVSGHDISDLAEGKGVLNWEHENGSPDDIIGAIVYAKKIMKKADCENERQELYWGMCGTPFVYIIAELFDSEDHPGAIAAAAMIRYYHKRNMKILAGFSIEGSTLERDENVLKRSVGRRVALTLRPCNKSAVSGVLEDEAVDKDIKKFMDLRDNKNIKTVEIDSLLVDDISKSDTDPLEALRLSIKTLNKTLTAGGYDVAPSQLTGGSALQVEHREKRKVGLSKDVKEKLKRAISSWDNKRPLRDVIKAVMPEVSEEYVDHFTELASDLTLKKGMVPPVRVEPYHSWNINMDHKQRELLSGIYVDRGSESASEKTNLEYKNDAGQKSTLRFPSPDRNKTAENASAYYGLASNFFGMGDHVPVTNHFNHISISKNPNPISVQEVTEGAHTPYSSEWSKTLQQGKNDGTVHKLAVMDMILGADSDRHSGNMIGKEGKVINIDNSSALSYVKSTHYPTHFDDFQGEDGYVEDGVGKDMMHIDAIRWLSELEPKKMAEYFLKSEVDKPKVLEAVRRLKVLQAQSSGKSIYQLYDMLNKIKKEV